MERIELVANSSERKGKTALGFLGMHEARKAHGFHQSFYQYRETPLHYLRGLSKVLGVRGIYVKDESYRFGLNAFKVLGGSYAIGTYIAHRLGRDITDLSYQELISDEVRSALGDTTFITATDGNHGRGVAWTANVLRQKAIVYMPRGSAAERLENIRALGAKAEILDLNYDECVAHANAEAEQHGYVMVQDTAWEGYEDIPTWIIQGYTTMALEAYEDLEDKGIRPTHIFLQAGVGSMASAVTGFFCSQYPDLKPTVVVVEPRKADCVFRTAKANDGKLHPVTGRMDTIMAGLACGEPCTVAWDVLEGYADYFMSVPEYVAALGMRVLGNPVKGDPRVVSGESGAVTTGVVAELCRKERFAEFRDQIGLRSDSRVLIFNTEGNTDPVMYRNVVWDGELGRGTHGPESSELSPTSYYS